MVDFKKKLRTTHTAKPVDPIQIYSSLDRASDKGPLRPSQHFTLTDWHANRRSQKNVILKLHTGQGKTLIGLLMLQSYLNDGVGPCIFLCPNNQLVDQVVTQAGQFGIKVCTAAKSAPLPADFLDSQSIYVTTAQRVFNGLTKFGLGPKGRQIGAFVLDDCHYIADTIAQQTAMRIPSGSNLYKCIIDLFRPSLEQQGSGTLSDIERGRHESVLRVPYWDIVDKRTALERIISESGDETYVKFSWKILRDMASQCDIYISGREAEIRPIACPIDIFSSFHNAQHRIFMSATLADDSFLVRSLGVTPSAVTTPLLYDEEKWSGEKMVLIPELINHDLSSSVVAAAYAKQDPSRQYGVVALTGSFKSAETWEANGASKHDSDSIDSAVAALRGGDFLNAHVLSNRYDGIDLPDAACRILIIDGLPHGTSAGDLYEASTFHGDQELTKRMMRKIEQGMGRSVRGERDFSAVILTGSDLVTAIRLRENQQFLSDQTREQIRIGLDIAADASEEASPSEPPITSLNALIQQCLGRDEGWKEFYSTRMDQAQIQQRSPSPTERYSLLRQIDEYFLSKQYQRSAELLQTFIDKHRSDFNNVELSLHLERLALMTHFFNAAKASDIQRTAYSMNRYILMPCDQVPERSVDVDTARSSRVFEHISHFVDPTSLLAHVDGVLRQMTFGNSSDPFEESIRNAGLLLGFASFRPEKEDRRGPDNAWITSSDSIIAIECKSEVKTDRSSINKYEIGQLLNAHEWAKKYFPHLQPTSCIIIPPKYCNDQASPGEDCRCIGEQGLRKLRNSIRTFYTNLCSQMEHAELSEEMVSNALIAVSLDATFIQTHIMGHIGFANR